MVKRIVGWVCIVGSLGVGIALLVVWLGKIELSSASVFLRAAFILPIALIYGVRLVRGPSTVPGR